MHFPSSAPLGFSGAPTFVEQHGDRVWFDLCDSYPVGRVLHVQTIASEMESLHGWSDRPRRLRAVLSAIRADFAERPDVYEGKMPFRIVGTRLARIEL